MCSPSKHPPLNMCSQMQLECYSACRHRRWRPVYVNPALPRLNSIGTTLVWLVTTNYGYVLSKRLQSNKRHTKLQFTTRSGGANINTNLPFWNNVITNSPVTGSSRAASAQEWKSTIGEFLVTVRLIRILWKSWNLRICCSFVRNDWVFVVFNVVGKFSNTSVILVIFSIILLTSYSF